MRIQCFICISLFLHVDWPFVILSWQIAFFLSTWLVFYKYEKLFCFIVIFFPSCGIFCKQIFQFIISLLTLFVSYIATEKLYRVKFIHLFRIYFAFGAMLRGTFQSQCNIIQQFKKTFESLIHLKFILV